MRRVGIYGGSFDPFHLGHLIPTMRAQETFQFDALYFVPAAHPPHKDDRCLTSITHRFAMVAMATLPYERFFVSDSEVFEVSPTYTIETVNHFQREHPDDHLYFLLGSDSFSQMSSWERWQELADLAHLVVLRRAHMWGEELRQRIPDGLVPRLRQVEPFQTVPDPEEQTIYLLNHEPFPISATSIRERLRRKRSIRELVPHEVFSYIDKYGLYGVDDKEGCP
jgi:nicotinate-nucleotide adenylyltransferase